MTTRDFPPAGRDATGTVRMFAGSGLVDGRYQLLIYERKPSGQSTTIETGEWFDDYDAALDEIGRLNGCELQ